MINKKKLLYGYATAQFLVIVALIVTIAFGISNPDFRDSNGYLIGVGAGVGAFLLYATYSLFYHRNPTNILIGVSITVCLLVILCINGIIGGIGADSINQYCTGFFGVRESCIENSINAISFISLYIIGIPILPAFAIFSIVRESITEKKWKRRTVRKPRKVHSGSK